MPENNEQLLELNSDRVIVLSDRRRQYRLTCRRITAADWTSFFTGIVITSQQDGRERINVTDTSTPRLALVDDVLVNAEGYQVVGDLDLKSLPRWKDRLPLAHRLQLGDVLADVQPSQTNGDLHIDPEGEVVFLDAAWSAEPGQSTVSRYVCLKHVLNTPTEAQHRRYSAEASRSRVVGGSRTGKTVYASAQPLLARLYDELVITVQGYALNGQPLTERDQIVREMDMLHKVVAAQELFNPQSTAVLVAEGDDSAE